MFIVYAQLPTLEAEFFHVTYQKLMSCLIRARTFQEL